MSKGSYKCLTEYTPDIEDAMFLRPSILSKWRGLPGLAGQNRVRLRGTKTIQNLTRPRQTKGPLRRERLRNLRADGKRVWGGSNASVATCLVRRPFRLFFLAAVLRTPAKRRVTQERARRTGRDLDAAAKAGVRSSKNVYQSTARAWVYVDRC